MCTYFNFFNLDLGFKITNFSPLFSTLPHIFSKKSDFFSKRTVFLHIKPQMRIFFVEWNKNSFCFKKSHALFFAARKRLRLRE